MIYSVRGKLVHTTPSGAVVECAGVGYYCQTTVNTLKQIKIGAEVTLYTYLNVREDAMELFGFATVTELETFTRRGLRYFRFSAPSRSRWRLRPTT